MYAMRLVLGCLACLGNAQVLNMAPEDVDPAQALAALLLASGPDAGFVSSPVMQHSSARVDRRSQIDMKGPDAVALPGKLGKDRLRMRQFQRVVRAAKSKDELMTPKIKEFILKCGPRMGGRARKFGYTKEKELGIELDDFWLEPEKPTPPPEEGEEGEGEAKE